mmetsp:Transcript_3279/g.9087  ORF Transcript_3279/g.9087 Transcript_3279/m.9087 type:complete len:113 (-) Transcript_3279:517-855(-)
MVIMVVHDTNDSRSTLPHHATVRKDAAPPEAGEYGSDDQNVPLNDAESVGGEVGGGLSFSCSTSVYTFCSVRVLVITVGAVPAWVNGPDAANDPGIGFGFASASASAGCKGG